MALAIIEGVRRGETDPQRLAAIANVRAEKVAQDTSDESGTVERRPRRLSHLSFANVRKEKPA
jgi:hypothetical protein